nr:ASCH domain-containing protein [Mesotoga sp.]
MKLLEEPFELIRTSRKTVEVRLNDDKRKKISAGDVIVFTSISSGETLEVQVLGVRSFATFDELFDSYDVERFGEDVDSLLKRIRSIFSDNDERRFGVLAIEIELVLGT